MKKLIAILLVLALCGTLPAICAAETENEAFTEQLWQGSEMPDFTVTLADGSVFNLNEQLATHDCVMINIWATWCNPCCMEMPIMQEAYAGYKDRVALVCLSPDDSNEDIVAFQQENGLEQLPLGYDSVGLAGALIQEGYPTTIIVDRFGVYAYYECGAILDVGGFTRMWDYFISEDYTESEIVMEIPGPDYEGEIPSDEALTEALCKDGSVSVSYNSEDLKVWPFIPTENGAVNTNTLSINTSAAITASFTAKAGDVFAVDYTADFETLYDELDIFVNDEQVKTVVYGSTSTFVYPVDEDGEYTVELSYTQSTEVDEEFGPAGTVELSNMRVVSGDEAAAVLAAQPVYSYALSGDDYKLEILNENAKKVRLSFPKSAGLDIAGAYGTIEMYIVPEDTASFRMLLGDAYDAEFAVGYGDYDGVLHVCSLCDTDGEGYIFETELSSVEAGSYCNTYVSMYPDALDYYNGVTFYIFKSEENMNYFCAYDIMDYDYNYIEGVTWKYADGTLPSTDAIAGADTGFMYNIYIIDENGEPVDGVMVNVCTDTNCTPGIAQGGYYGFDGEQYPYVIHVLKVPEGYSFDTATEFVMNAEGDSLTITVPHA